MKKLLIAAFAFVFMPLSVLAAQFEEGKHYEVLNLPASSKPEVKEFFSFYCGHCFKFEPLIAAIKKGLPAGVKLQKSHVDFIPQRQPEAAKTLTKALIAAELLKVEAVVIPKIFSAIHVEKKGIVTESTIRSIFSDAGIDAKKFDAAYNNFMVESQVQHMKIAQNKAKIRSVPSLIVNGKYRAIPNELKSEADYIALINYLTTLK
ncbi:thiol:disulfide interchange protein DsbA/DsbL [Algibacillus agarilyticus]|uniref:thiol:disulfide interchange protein DsbA/DsbL n=1 Tax=Algibacillus agarilyticus TaxID=2234133 RepID=UPI000DD04110|nr:thiol:disulfide interchange protein DsbA/DsbL [Algibacillus agarilyticus]